MNDTAVLDRYLLFFRRRVGLVSRQGSVAHRQLRTRPIAAAALLGRFPFGFSVRYQVLRQLHGYIACALDALPALAGFVKSLGRRPSLRRLFRRLISSRSLFRRALAFANFFVFLFLARLIRIALFPFGVSLSLLIFLVAFFFGVALRRLALLRVIAHLRVLLALVIRTAAFALLA